MTIKALLLQAAVLIFNCCAVYAQISGAFSQVSSPTGTTLNSIHGSSADNIIAVGDSGVIVLFTGAGQSAQMLSPTGNRLNGVWVNSPADALAVGDFGTILRFDGVQWTQQSGATQNRLNDVWSSADGSAVAVGDLGTVVRFDGGSWQAVPAPTGNNLNSVWGSGPAEVFIVGDRGLILFYNGSQFSAMASPTGTRLNGVWGSSASDVFAVGDQGTVIHFDGTRWIDLGSPSGNRLNDVWSRSVNEAVAVGDFGSMVRFNGSQWSGTLSGTGNSLNGVWGSSNVDVLAVGNSGTVVRTAAVTGIGISGTPAPTAVFTFTPALVAPTATFAATPTFAPTPALTAFTPTFAPTPPLVITPFAAGPVPVLMPPAIPTTGPTVPPQAGSFGTQAGISTAAPGAVAPTAGATGTATAAGGSTTGGASLVRPTLTVPAVGTGGTPQATVSPTGTPAAAATVGTPQASASPTVGSNPGIAITGVIRDETGNAVSGVTVFSRELGSTASDEAGFYKFRRAVAGRSYSLTFKAEDHSIRPASLLAGPGWAPDIVALSKTLAHRGCVSQNYSALHVRMDSEALAMRDLVHSAADRLAEVSRMRVNRASAGRLLAAAETCRRAAGTAFSKAMLQSMKLPVVALSCQPGSDCSRVDYRTDFAAYRSAVRALRGSVLGASGAFEKYLPESRMQSRHLRSKAALLFRSTMRLAAALPRQSASCAH